MNARSPVTSKSIASIHAVNNNWHQRERRVSFPISRNAYSSLARSITCGNIVAEISHGRGNRLHVILLDPAPRAANRPTESFTELATHVLACNIHDMGANLSPLIEQLGTLIEEGSSIGAKNKWVSLTLAQVKADPKLQDALFGLVQNAYAPIGGHLKIKSSQDLVSGEVSVIAAIDLDQDDEPDAVSIAKKKPAGLKSVGMGQDGTSTAKSAVVKRKATELKTGMYSEMSDKIAHIMLTRHSVPSIDDEARVAKVLGKKIEWVGAHPDGKYPKNKGWYRRTIGGKLKMKILLGTPH